jgi:hypothetical protein
MMSDNEQAPSSQHNTIYGSGNITAGGLFVHSPVTSTAVNAGPDTASHAFWIDRLAGELAKARALLEEGHGSAAEPDLEDAVATIKALQEEIQVLREDSTADSPAGAEGRRTLRLRVKALIGVLLPVAEVIGGVAGIQEILHHL